MSVVPFPEHLIGEIDNFLEVFLCFRGKPDHEIELDRFPPGIKYFSRGGEEGLFGVSLVYHIPQPLCPGLRREREACLAHPFYLIDQLRGKGSTLMEGRAKATLFS